MESRLLDNCERRLAPCRRLCADAVSERSAQKSSVTIDAAARSSPSKSVTNGPARLITQLHRRCSGAEQTWKGLPRCLWKRARCCQESCGHRRLGRDLGGRGHSRDGAKPARAVQHGEQFAGQAWATSCT